MPGRNAAELIVNQINAAGGIGGVPLKPVYVDEGQGTDGVVAEFRRLASDASMQAMVAALSSEMRAALFGLNPLDPAAYLLAVFSLAIVVCAAVYLPSRRALGLAPLEALRHDA